MPPRRTGTLQLDRAQHAPQPGFRNLVAFHDEMQRPRTLRVDVRALVPGRDTADQRSMALAAGTCGVWWSDAVGDTTEDAPWQGGAAIKLSYGSTPGIEREVYADLRAGEFAIPPCMTLEVAVAYWRPLDQLDDVLGDALLEVAVEIADGEPGPDCSPLILTATRRVDAGYSVGCSVPPGAYAFDLLPGSRTHVAALCGGQRVVRRQGGAWTPPTHPVLIAGADCRHVSVWTDDELSGSGEGETATWDAGVVFYVR